LHRYPYLAPRLGAPRSTRACHTFPVLVIGTSHRGVASLQSSLSSYTHRLTSLALSLYVAKFIPPDVVAVGPSGAGSPLEISNPSVLVPLAVAVALARAPSGLDARAPPIARRASRARVVARRRRARDAVPTRFKSLRASRAPPSRVARAAPGRMRSRRAARRARDDRAARVDVRGRRRRRPRRQKATRDGGRDDDGDDGDGDGGRERGRARGQGARDGATRARGKPTTRRARSR
jgi:hypothetical protein